MKPVLSLFVCALAASVAISFSARAAEETPQADPAVEESEALIGKALDAIRGGKSDQAVELATQAIAKAPKHPRGYLLRARIHASARNAKEALPDFDQVISLLPKSADLLDERGSEHFKLGNIKQSVVDFDRAVELDPRREASHWKRGISYYYAGKFAEGRKQFEGYQKFDSNDVENAVWRFLCMSREEGVGFEKAQADILKIGDDRRVPMRQVYDLFAGKAKPEEVLEAARAGGAALNDRLFYAHQYLALYFEAKGDSAASLEHMKKAVDHPIGHYMWDVAKVHVDLRKPPKN